MSESQRKRQKLEVDWGDEDDFFLTNDQLTELESQTANYFMNINRPIPGTSIATETNSIPISLIPEGNSNIIPSSICQQAVIQETPLELDATRAKLNSKEAELLEAEQKIKILIEQKNIALGETKIVRDRYNNLEKEIEREKKQKRESMELNETELKSTKEKYFRKIENLESEMKFKDQELLKLRMRCEESERKVSKATLNTFDKFTQCEMEIDVKVSEMGLILTTGEITCKNIISHLLTDGDGVFNYTTEDCSNACGRWHVPDDNICTIQQNGKPLIHNSQNSSSDTKIIRLKYAILQNFLNSNPGSRDTNFNSGLEFVLEFLEKRLAVCVDTLQKNLQIKPAEKTSSAESFFSSLSTASSNSSTKSMTQCQFSDHEEEKLLILNFLLKTINANPNLLTKPTNDIIETQSSDEKNDNLVKSSIQHNGDLVKSSNQQNDGSLKSNNQQNSDLVKSNNNHNSLCDNLVKLIHLQYLCHGKYKQKLQTHVIIRILRIFSAVVGENKAPVVLQNFIFKGSVLDFLHIEKGNDILNSCLDLINVCINHFRSLNWICSRIDNKKVCYLSTIATVCALIVKSASIYDEDRLQLIDKIIDLMISIFQHHEGTLVLASEPDDCNCSCKILNEVMIALNEETEKCITDINTIRFQVLSKGIRFLHSFLSADPYFMSRKLEMRTHYTRLIANTNFAYSISRKGLICEDQLLVDLDDS